MYVCARAIAEHRGDRRACGSLCRIAQGDEEDKYQDEDVLKVLEDDRHGSEGVHMPSQASTTAWRRCLTFMTGESSERY